MEKENEALEKKLRVQQTKIDELKSELRKARAETRIKILPGSNDDSIGVEVIPQDLNLLVKAEKKPKENFCKKASKGRQEEVRRAADD